MTSFRQVDADHLMSVSAASSKGLSALMRHAESGVPTVLLRGSTPVAAVMPMEAYYAWLASKHSDAPAQAGER